MDTSPTRLTRSDTWTSATVAIVIFCLLAGVAIGWIYALEAAAMGGVLLFTVALLRGQLSLASIRLVLGDTMALTGALFALLIAATTFSLVLRAFGTDRLISQALQSLGSQPWMLLLSVLAGMLACSFVLDAFMIFLVIPLVMPPVLMTVNDAAWVAASLVLLVLQLGFLLPPVGYALVMSRSMLREPVGTRDLAKALWPQWVVQSALIAARR